MSFNFTVSEQEYKKFKAWEKEMYAKGIETQKQQYPEPSEVMKECWDMGFPYGGAIGGQFTWCFTPTSIGTVIVVKDYITGEEIDVTDYGMF